MEEGAGGDADAQCGGHDPLARTSPALDLDALIGGFRPLFRALDPDQINALSGQLITALQGQGGTINSFLAQTAALTSTLADRDQLIGEVIINLNTVLGSLGDQSDQFAKAVNSLSELVDGLESRGEEISGGLAYTNAAAGSITDLLSQARPPLQKVVHETDRRPASWWPTTTTSTTSSTPSRMPIRRWPAKASTATFSASTCATLVIKTERQRRTTGVHQGGRPVQREVCTAMKPFSERNQLVIGAVGLGVTAAIVLGR